MKITVEIPDTSEMLMLNALYKSGEDLRLTSAGVTLPHDGETVTLDAVREVAQ